MRVRRSRAMVCRQGAGYLPPGETVQALRRDRVDLRLRGGPEVSGYLGEGYMSPETFSEANTTIGPPPDMDESQVRAIPAHISTFAGGNCDGAMICVVAWRPTAEELGKL